MPKIMHDYGYRGHPGTSSTKVFGLKQGGMYHEVLVGTTSDINLA